MQHNHTQNHASDTMNEVFKALADPTRRTLLDLLYAKGGQTLNELAHSFAKIMSRQAVMKHLEILESANLIVIVWNGREKHHHLNPIPIHAIQDRWIRKFEKQRLSAIAALKDALESSENHNLKNESKKERRSHG